MTEQEKKQAIQWLCKNYDLVTVAQHFGLTRDELAREIRTV